MDKEKFSWCLDALTEVHDWSRGEVEIGVSIYRDEYYVDLGTFGEQCMSVEVEDDGYPLEIERVLDYAPHNLDEIRDTLREILDAAEEEKESETLDGVLATMQASGTDDDKRLARVLAAVVAAFRPEGFPSGAPLPFVPTEPAPWPGAMREDIDYTANDFPLRYQPPPGYVWSKIGSSSAVIHTEATKQSCEMLRSYVASGSGEMVLDAKGRVSWMERDDELFADEEGRWSIWFKARDGFPSGSSAFTKTTAPLALDADGVVIGEWRDQDGRTSPWPSESVADAVMQRAREIRERYVAVPAEEKPKEEFAPPEPVAL